MCLKILKCLTFLNKIRNKYWNLRTLWKNILRFWCLSFYKMAFLHFHLTKSCYREFMTNLEKNVNTFNKLLIKGETLKAMEQFFDENVSMHENEEPPRVGKTVCIEHERNMLSRVDNLEINILNQAINTQSGIVFTELDIRFTPKKGAPLQIVEVSVQTWQNGKIMKDKFYYKEILKA